ncbi:MAG: glycosyltransferase family 4 protein, partial [Chloroflexi bacterium]|nr:glycosyltransferase family 4 protein [Chloroflexota bacterium]
CPVALLEAMACGKACVATDVPGSRDIIEDGVSGLLVEPENAIDLASAIQRLINDRQFRERIGKAARIRIEEHFSIEKEVAAHEKLYEEILAGKGKNHDW